jgi:hypothetical protein
VDDSMTDNSATCGCGAGEAASPWDMQSAVVNQVLMSAPALIGAVALARYRRRKLLIFLPAAIAFLTVWRRYTCARCRYYGQACSTLLGVATARMMPRDTTKELDRQTMQLDFAFLGAVMLIPLRQVLKSRGLRRRDPAQRLPPVRKRVLPHEGPEPARRGWGRLAAQTGGHVRLIRLRTPPAPPASQHRPACASRA